MYYVLVNSVVTIFFLKNWSKLQKLDFDLPKVNYILEWREHIVSYTTEIATVCFLYVFIQLELLQSVDCSRVSCVCLYNWNCCFFLGNKVIFFFARDVIYVVGRTTCYLE